MKRRTFALLPFTAACLRAKPAPKRMLWTGSSSMYYHSLPKIAAEWLTRLGGNHAYESEIVGRSGDGIHVYLKPGTFKPEYGFREGQTFLEKVSEGRYDYVVLQAVARFLVGPTAEDHYAALDTYVKAIREAGGEPVYYEMGWGLGDTDDPGRQRILESARKNRIRIFVPCSSAWKRVRTERPDLELHNLPDRSHPGTLGHYLNLCCFFAAITGKNPNVLPREYPVWLALSEAERTESEQRRQAATFTDRYDQALPAFLQRRTVMAKPYTIAPDTATYFQKVAQESWKEKKRLLS
jgi:hypothetical protein